jgi:hypothetical protein
MTGYSSSHDLFPKRPLAMFAGCLLLALGTQASISQVIIMGPNSTWARYAKVEPTHVQLASDRLTGKTRTELIRLMQAEQGFAVRPVQKGSKGLVLIANGGLNPGGKDYLHALEEKGVSVKPGDRVLITDVKIEHNKIIFDFNGGPDHKHKWLRHIQVGTSSNTSPIVQDDPQDPVGSRFTLSFEGEVPEMTGAQVKALMEPVVDFTFKSPVQAFVDALPPQLRTAILNHEVLVGMSTEMVVYSIGKPDHKSREVEGQMPYEEWIYGEPPHDVEFVRINGNRVIRVAMAKPGQDLEVRDKNEVESIQQAEEHQVQVGGDTVSNPDVAQKAPPTLKGAGETLPSDRNAGSMGPVIFPEGMGQQKPLPPDLQQAPVSVDDDPPAKPGDKDPNAAPTPAQTTPPAAQPAPAPAAKLVSSVEKTTP